MRTILFLAPDGAELPGPLTLAEGEMVDVSMVLREAGKIPRDLTSAVTITWTVGTLEDDPIVDEATLVVVGAPASGTVKYAAAPELTAVGGRYRSVAVVTFPGTTPIVRKFVGDVVIETSIDTPVA